MKLWKIITKIWTRQAYKILYQFDKWNSSHENFTFQFWKLVAFYEDPGSENLWGVSWVLRSFTATWQGQTERESRLQILKVDASD